MVAVARRTGYPKKTSTIWAWEPYMAGNQELKLPRRFPWGTPSIESNKANWDAATAAQGFKADDNYGTVLQPARMAGQNAPIMARATKHRIISKWRPQAAIFFIFTPGEPASLLPAGRSPSRPVRREESFPACPRACAFSMAFRPGHMRKSHLCFHYLNHTQ